jgi:hypothetical protein
MAPIFEALLGVIPLAISGGIMAFPFILFRSARHR